MTSKTAAAVLQELMVKLGEIPEYECVPKSGPPHMAIFEYRCNAYGASAVAEARSKKDAKQEVARMILLKLSERGVDVPPPYGCRILVSPSTSIPQPPAATVASTAPRSAVALLKELTEQYNLPAVDYELIDDTGPPHMKHFTIKATMGRYERIATSTTKKAARQIAADQLYTYLRENLSRITHDFVEEEALVRAHEKAMDRYVEAREERIWRPDLGQKISDYHLNLLTQIDQDNQTLARQALEATSSLSPESSLSAVAAALGFNLEYSELEAIPTMKNPISKLVVIELLRTSPALTFTGDTRNEAASEAIDYIRLALIPLSFPRR